MGFLEILFTAFGLSMDAFAISITNGATLKDLKTNTALKISGTFGLFQAGMPLLGWLIGINFEKYVTRFDHWIVFGVLSFIGAKMIYEARKENNNGDNNGKCLPEEAKKEALTNITLFVLAVATSLDALSVGISFAFIGVPILKSIILIGVVTFVVCLAGVEIGKKCLLIFKNHAELFGGIILMLIGLKILLEHLNIFEIFRANYNVWK